MRHPRLVDLLEIIATSEVKQKRKSDCYGEIDYSNLSIHIDPRQTAREKVNTLLHEAIHAYYTSNRTKQSENQIIRDAERITRRLYERS